MKRFFSAKSQTKSTHVVGMTQYFTHNFSDPDCPDYVSTYDITSCVVLLIKNIDETKTCSHFGMAHLNFANVYFKDKAIGNISSFIEDFEKNGGNLTTASIQLLGGLIDDINLVRERIISALREVLEKKGLAGITIKVPDSFKVDTSVESSKVGNTQVMSIAFDKKGTYTRKVVFKSGKVVDKVFFPSDCQLLSDSNVKYIVPVEPFECARLKEKTRTFQIVINQLMCSKVLPSSSEYSAKENEIKELYCTIERSDAYTQRIHSASLK